MELQDAKVGLKSNAVKTKLMRIGTKRLVTLGHEVCPWMQEACPQRVILLVAYIAGNIEPQIKKKVCQDHAYSGALETLKVYEKLRAEEKIQRIEVLEQWETLETAGKLESFMERVLEEGGETQVADAERV